MKNAKVVCILLTVLAATWPWSADARGGGGRGGGGGARASAARAGASRSAPSNYGSMRPAQVPPSNMTGLRPGQVPPSRAEVASQVQGAGALRDPGRPVATPHGGDIAAGAAAGAAVVLAGRAAADIKDGDRIAAGQGNREEIIARVRADGDGVIENLPDGARRIYIDDDPYYWHNHHYYWPYYYGGSVYYQEVYPPYGTSEEDLPSDAETVVVGDATYYVYDDVYYVKEGDNYVVTAEPVIPGPDPAELLKAMCAHVGTYANFFVDTTEEVERPGKGMAVVKRRIVISHPDRVAAAGREGSKVTRFWYDGKTVSSLDEEKNVYSTVEAPGSIRAMMDMLQDEYGVTIPLTDLLLPDLCDELAPVLATMKYATKETAADRICHKVTLMTDAYYAQLWIDADEKAPLPRKVDITYFAEGKRPRYVAVINSWESKEKINPAQFAFEPPADAQKIEMLKR